MSRGVDIQRQKKVLLHNATTRFILLTKILTFCNCRRPLFLETIFLYGHNSILKVYFVPAKLNVCVLLCSALLYSAINFLCFTERYHVNLFYFLVSYLFSKPKLFEIVTQFCGHKVIIVMQQFTKPSLHCFRNEARRFFAIVRKICEFKQNIISLELNLSFYLGIFTRIHKYNLESTY